MAVTLWDLDTTPDPLIASGPSNQVNPVVADSHGGEFAVAWIDQATNAIAVTFYDEQGLPAAVRPTVTVTDGVYAATGFSATLSGLQMANGGTGVGYGLVWEEATAGQPTVLRLRYIGLTDVVGPEIAVAPVGLGLHQHDAAISGYTKDDSNGRPNVDGFDVVWVESASASPHAPGSVYVQRFAVPLDRAKDPVGPPVAAGADGLPATAPNAPLVLTTSGRDPSVAGLTAAANEIVVAWINAADNRVALRVLSDDGAIQITNNNLGTAKADGELHTLGLSGGGFVVAWIGDSDSSENVNRAIQARVYTPGATAGTFTTSAVFVLQDISETVQDFALGAQIESGGFP